GGIILVISAPWYFASPLGFLSPVVPVSGALVYKGKGSPKLLGLTIIVSALLSFGSILEPILNLAGILLSVIAGLKILFWKLPHPRYQKRFLHCSPPRKMSETTLFP